MAQYTGYVSSWELPQLVGELYTADIVPGAEEVNPYFPYLDWRTEWSKCSSGPRHEFYYDC